ncbi:MULTISPECIES: Sll0314/Alr1548 family TPR repeat-containing protein [Aerosakkonema]|uniref:Sll0314/Alr1548 family TPR repeat-containing protein n=1 Tax=Aerosakkonema TaxID=1246629 RepID=UPI0035B77813
MMDLFPTAKLIVSAFTSAYCKHFAPRGKWHFVGVTAIALSLWPNPILAGDPFRSSNPKPIGNSTEAAFKALFKEGNYKETAELYLPEAESKEPNEPMVYALKASLAYTDWQGDKKNKALLESLKSYAAKTRETAANLKATDPLRGNLYIAAGHALEAAAIVGENGTVKGAPQALSKLQEVYRELDAAEKINANDPELNLLKGWMDLLISVNLPFTDPQQAIERLEKAAPPYLAYRGMAVGYRDLKQYDKALQYVDVALRNTPDNPELQYLKAQILVGLDKNQEAKEYFQNALTKSAQLPKDLVAQVVREQCKNQVSIDRKERNCSALRNQVKQMDGKWGPIASQLPNLD